MLKKKLLIPIIAGTIIVGTGMPIMAKSMTGTGNNNPVLAPASAEYKSDEFYSNISDVTSNYFVDDCAVVNSYDVSYKHEKKNRVTNNEMNNARSEKVKDANWLREYGINPGNLEDTRLDYLNEAHSWLGSWYLYGGDIPPKRCDNGWESPSTGRGFDCSSYVEYVTRKTKGFDIGRTTYDQPSSSHLHHKSLSNAEPGDLVYSTSGEHVGIFIKNNNNGTILMMHDPKTGDKVKIGRYHTSVNIYEVY